MKRIGLAIMIFLALLTACGSAASRTGSSAPEAPLPAGRQVEADSGEQSAGEGGAQPAADYRSATQQNAAQTQRLVIQTAEVSLLVADVVQAEAQARQIATRFGGYVLGLQTSGDDENRQTTITMRVPAQQFDATLNALYGLAQRVESSTIEGQDVTEEFVDLESRKRNLEAVEARLLQFLNQAQRVQDLLEINQRLAEVQGQLEEIEGRMRYLRESAAYSTITARLLQPPMVSARPEPGWSPLRTAAQATSALLSFGQVLADVLIVLAIWAPVWLLPLLLLRWLLRRTRRVSVPPSQPSS